MAGFFVLVEALTRTGVIAILATPRTTDAILIGIDLGPNLSVTGPLATILWLTAIRREGENLDFCGIVVMPPARLLALGMRFLLRTSGVRNVRKQHRLFLSNAVRALLLNTGALDTFSAHQRLLAITPQRVGTTLRDWCFLLIRQAAGKEFQ